AAIGLLGPGSAQALANAQLPIPEAGDSVLRDGVLIARQPDGTRAKERFLLIGPAQRAGCEQLKAQPVDSGVWWWSQIDAGLPNVWAATQEKFVPQMINLEVLGGVDFRKGCYPGQEVIARSQYRGKLRRRMHLAHTEVDTHAGADVLAQGQDQPVGTVVMAALAPQGGMDFLFECHADAVDAPLYVQGATPDHSALLRALPYPITDVTA
ncbi:MAG TPA: folate-binding protein, partial [Burkholderiaceae bacterium]|nr:folate-binding protein [Burkholderiaceae bacterium]